MTSLFPEDSDARKTYPVFSGLLQYFPSALAKVAHHSYHGNEKHNPGQPLHHDRAKSSDEPDALVRHLMEGDYVGMAWRALSLLQKHCEEQGAPIAPAARNAARQLYDEASAMAEAQDAVLDIDWNACFPTRAEVDDAVDLLAKGIPAESAYLASFSPNGSRIATAAEIEGLRDLLSAEELKGFGIGDAERRDVAETATTVATSQHPMAAEALRDHDERLNGPEDHL